MSIVGKAIGSVLRRVVERQARGRSWNDLARTLAESGDDLAQRMHDAPDTPMQPLSEAFAITRADTVALARKLEAEGVDAGRQVRHNDLGDLTLGAWLAYLDGHARREARRLGGCATWSTRPSILERGSCATSCTE